MQENTTNQPNLITPLMIESNKGKILLQKNWYHQTIIPNLFSTIEAPLCIRHIRNQQESLLQSLPLWRLKKINLRFQNHWINLYHNPLKLKSSKFSHLSKLNNSANSNSNSNKFLTTNARAKKLWKSNSNSAVTKTKNNVFSAKCNCLTKQILYNRSWNAKSLFLTKPSIFMILLVYNSIWQKEKPKMILKMKDSTSWFINLLRSLCQKSKNNIS